MRALDEAVRTVFVLGGGSQKDVCPADEDETFALSKPRPLLQLCCNQLKLTGRHATIRFFLLAEIRSFICSNGATM
jgi:hypothetical protein